MISSSTAEATSGAAEHPAGAQKEFPVREYIAAMAVELAQMARWDGDEALGRLLDSAATLANEAPVRPPVEIERSRQRRPA